MLRYEKKDSVAILTLDRPERDNAIDTALAQELNDAMAQIVEDDDVRVIVIRGAGETAFCGGQDLRDLAEKPQKTPAEMVLPRARPYWQALVESDRIAVAAIHGKCLGRGLALALACDIRISADDAEFGFPEVSTGTIPAAGGTQLLPRTVPKGMAMEMILTARTIDAAEAHRIGLVNKIVKPDQLDEATDELVKTLVSMGPIALKYAKEACLKGLDVPLEQGMRIESDLYALVQTTEDRKEGIKAFLEKRPPRFVGR
ncbi:MAG: enoyl-CoA hydratase/isomerase family protein [Dehalococcoidia bacterium]|nr:enoyl-CoA hydratase/isomerase family protein [Dehalococcoidia bacterium]